MKFTRVIDRWVFEAFIDVRCLMVGVNWTSAADHVPSFYLHVGPFIIGAFRDTWTREQRESFQKELDAAVRQAAS